MSEEDPFNSIPEDSAPEPEPVKDVTAVTESLDGKLTITFKGAGGFADRWIVVYAASAADGLAQIQDPAFVELLNKSRTLAEWDYKKATEGKPVQASNPGQQQPHQAPQGATQAPGGEKRFCSHGEMVFKSGVSKAGNAYKLFSCTAPREQQCKAEYLK